MFVISVIIHTLGENKTKYSFSSNNPCSRAGYLRGQEGYVLELKCVPDTAHVETLTPRFMEHRERFGEKLGEDEILKMGPSR